LQIADIVDWKPIRELLEEMYKNKSEKGGRPNCDVLLMFRIPILEERYGLIDLEVMRQIADRVYFMGLLIRHARVLTAWQGRGIGGQILARLLALADPGRPIPASTEASADRTGGYLVVLADGRRILGPQGLRRRRGVLEKINKIC